MDSETAAIASQLTPEFLFTQGTVVLIGLLVIREMIWKAIALWKAGGKRDLARFVCIFIFNTVGILPIIYLVFFQKKGKK